jgi:hypothetical protein
MKVITVSLSGGAHSGWHAGMSSCSRRSFEPLDGLSADCRQPGGGGPSAGNAAEWRNLQQGGKHESAQVHAWVRHAELWAIDHPLIVEQQVEVEGARGMVELATATEATLDDEQHFEQLLRVKHGLNGRYGVDEIGLATDPHRRRAIKRRDLQQSRFGQIGQRRCGGAQLGPRIGEIGAERDESQV